METAGNDYLQVGFEEELLADGGGEPQDDDAEETQQDGLVVGVGAQVLSLISVSETHLEVVGDEVDEDDGGVLETLRLLDDMSHELQQQRVLLHALVEVGEGAAEHAALDVAGQLADHLGEVLDAFVKLAVRRRFRAHLLLRARLVHLEEVSAVEDGDQVAQDEVHEGLGEGNGGGGWRGLVGVHWLCGLCGIHWLGIHWIHGL